MKFCYSRINISHKINIEVDILIRIKKRAEIAFRPSRFDHPESEFEDSQSDPHVLRVVISRGSENLS